MNKKRRLFLILLTLLFLVLINVPAEAKPKRGQDISLPVGEKNRFLIGDIKPKNTEWISEDPSIFKITKTGKYVAVKEGQTEVTVKAGKYHWIFRVFVFDPKKNITGKCVKSGSVDFSIITNWSSTKDSKSPVHYVSSDTWMSSIEVDIFYPEKPGVFWIYVDRKYSQKIRVKTGTQVAIFLKGDELKPGKHSIEILQFSKNNPKNGYITYRKGNFTIKHE